jgi:hypothetical protein
MTLDESDNDSIVSSASAVWYHEVVRGNENQPAPPTRRWFPFGKGRNAPTNLHRPPSQQHLDELREEAENVHHSQHRIDSSLFCIVMSLCSNHLHDTFNMNCL